MKSRYVILPIALLIVFSGTSLTAQQRGQGGQRGQQRQSGVNVHRDGWDKVVSGDPITKFTPAPIRDITGIWEPTPRYRDGVQATGAREYPADGKPEHELPFTPLGLETWKSHKPGWGVTAG